jgi:hypothetical protein
MKNGGADVVVMKPQSPRDNRQGEVIRHAKMVADASDAKDPLVGHLIIGFFASGKTTVGIFHDPETCPIPRALVPSWLAEIARRDLIVDAEATDVFHEMFQWVE